MNSGLERGIYFDKPADQGGKWFVKPGSDAEVEIKPSDGGGRVFTPRDAKILQQDTVASGARNRMSASRLRALDRLQIKED